ncbi:helix-turn-helix domain-containing protein [Leuconostoc inhae]|uniref:helix-turn-helix domain-containing protein n=1 Tax=Leuconostoc inhae TaxID=178001 RepID=UPI003570D0C0
MPTLIALNSKSLTQKELAQHYHMTPRLVSKWVNQVRTTGYDALKIKHKRRKCPTNIWESDIHDCRIKYF